MGKHHSDRTGTHRGRTVFRGVSRGPVLVVLAIAVVAGLVAAWFLVRDRADRSDTDAAGGCLEGRTTLAVTADPDIAGILTLAAERYTAAGARVRDHCVAVTVTAKPAADVAAALAANRWEQNALGPRPGLWVPQSGIAARDLAPDALAGPLTPLALSPVVLAVPPPLRTALEKSQTGWSGLPALQQGTLADAGLPGWAGLRLALPPGGLSLTVAATVAAETAGTPGLADEAAKSGQVLAAVSGLAAGAPKTDSLEAGLAALTTDQGPQGAIHAVPATVRELQLRKSPLGAWQPAGARPVADHPAVPLSGDWVDHVQKQIATLFTEFLRQPEQAKLFSDAGFGVPPSAAQAAAAPPLASKAGFGAIQSALANPVLGVSSTVLVDVSSSMAVREGQLTRLQNVLAALQSQLTTLPPANGIGVWTAGPDVADGKPYRIESATGPLTSAHRAEVTAKLRGVRAGSGKSDNAYPALQAAFKAATSGFVAGRVNSVLLITDGPEGDSGVSAQQLLQSISAATDKTKPVRVDVVAITGSAPVQTTLKTLAQQTGGSFTPISSSDDASFGAALGQALTIGQ